MILAPTVLLLSATLAELLSQYQAQPDSVELCERIGITYLQEQQLEPATEFFRKALGLKPDFIPARKNLGTALWFLNRHDASLREFQLVLKVAPRDPVANLYTGLGAFERKEYLYAAARLEAAGDLAAANPEVRPIWLESLLRSAEQQDKSVRLQAAYETYRKTLQAFPESEAAYLAFSNFAAAHGNNEYARKIVDQGLTQLPNSARLLFERGITLALDGRIDESAAEFSQASKADPAWPLAAMAVGVSELQRANYAEAGAKFRESGRLSSDDWRPDYLYALAVQKSGDAAVLPEAIRALEHAVQVAPREAKLYTLLGQILMSQDRLNEAVPQLERAHRLAPGDATTLYQLGMLYRKQGRAADATRTMQAFQVAKANSRSEEAELIQILKTSAP